MGSFDFTDYIQRTDTIRTAADAFAFAQDRAGNDHGYGGYSGTIVEKPGFRFAQTEPVDLETGKTLARYLINEEPWADKWGNAGCLTIASQTTKERVLARSIKVENERHLDAYTPAIVDLAKPDETVMWVTVGSDDRKYKTTAVKNRGPATRVFKVGDAKFATRDEAVAAVVAIHERNVNGSQHPMAKTPTEIVETVERGGLPAAVVKTVMLSRKVAVEVAFSRPVGKPGDPTGWLFFGCASS